MSSAQLQLTMVNFSAGAYIVVEGKENANAFFIIREGKVQISKETEIVEEEGGNVLGPGDFFGVVSTMSSHSHIETARALTNCSLIQVQRENFHLLIERNTPVAMKIIQKFSQRMRHLDDALARLTVKGHTSEIDIGQLFTVAEYYAKQNQYNQAYYAYYNYVRFCPNGHDVPKARERIAKIKPYANAVYLDGDNSNFNREYPEKTMIFCEGMPGRELYIIQKGQVKITKIINDAEVVLAILKSSDIFGEMALLEEKPRSASAITMEDSKLLAVNKENFARMVQQQPQIIARLTQMLAERIWLIYRQLANTLLPDKLGRLYDTLYLQLEKNRVPIRPGEAYTFDFGTKELIGMVGMSASEAQPLVRELLKNSKIKSMDQKLHTSDVDELKKQAEYYRKMQRIEAARKARTRG